MRGVLLRNELSSLGVRTSGLTTERIRSLVDAALQDNEFDTATLKLACSPGDDVLARKALLLRKVRLVQSCRREGLVASAPEAEACVLMYTHPSTHARTNKQTNKQTNTHTVKLPLHTRTHVVTLTVTHTSLLLRTDAE